MAGRRMRSMPFDDWITFVTWIEAADFRFDDTRTDIEPVASSSGPPALAGAGGRPAARR
jgi:hypothetical protein